MIKVFSVAEMVAAEKASDAAGNTYDEMMEKAGWAVAEVIRERYPVAGSKVTVLVGPGNNGGDGLVAGRYLAEWGADISFYLYKERDLETDRNLALVREMNLPIIVSEYDQRYRVLHSRLRIADILIDALLGTGISLPIGGNLAKLMKQVKAVLKERERFGEHTGQSRLTNIADPSSGTGTQPGPGDTVQTLNTPFVQKSDMSTTQSILKIVAVDCPSGLDCDSGELDDLAMPADLTVTFAGPKRGHFIFPGAAACGEIVVADIDISAELPEVAEVKVELATAEMARTLMPDRPIDGHKGTFGWALIAAGSIRYWGAAVLAGQAAYRAGAGLVALAVPSSIRPAVATQLPEATYPLIADDDVFSAQSATKLLEDMGDYQALLVGPGLYEAGAFLETLLASEEVDLPPTVIDADGLNLLSQMPDWPSLLPAGTILTPHPGEMARLVGASLSEIKARDRVELAREKAAEWDCVVLLKGAFSIVAAPDGRCAILPFANPALATAGSGDVLSGIIVALLGQKLPAYEAAVLGGYLHGAAAQISEVDAGLLAGEIADLLPEVMEALKAR
jgi:NAD(P)H-hydrate epimerase